jgi:predicted AlkP superfamily phosphohydrolase/phosphomutase
MYIGPGAGFVFLGSFLTVFLSLILAAVSVVTWPFRMLWVVMRLRRGYRSAKVDKIVILGLDGFDPKLAERYMKEGKLPNLSRLASEGSYRRLRTTFPALSPVAWSTFATGVNPAKHNIFDFLNRDLKSYTPELSSSRIRPVTPRFRIGRWTLLSKPSIELRRKSTPFWKILGEHAIGSTIIRVPITFPPEEFKGRLLSAMCTPDLRGTQGTFSWFSTRIGDWNGEGPTRLTRDGDALEGELEGPEKLTARFRVSKDDIEIGGARHLLRLGEYTEWIHVSFRKDRSSAARGIVRFLLTESGAETSLYATPVQIDPNNPALPISHPHYYAIYLSKLLGPFATAGMAEDTWALNEGAIDEQAFLAQAESIKQERERMFFGALDRTRRGVVACVFDTTDRVQHMFYRYLDGRRDGVHAGVIERLYCDMDRLVGETMKYVDPKSAFFVLSDHGFCSFRRAVNLNTWLQENGYLTLQNGGGGKYFAGVDWDRTRAYTMGLGGLYLNLRGREANGAVAVHEAAALKRELIDRLTGLQDPETGEVAIRRVYAASELYQGPYLEAAPDLIIGYADGYRTSWDAAIGKMGATIFEDNNKAWSGDHCVDPSLVPGVLFSNIRIDADDPGLEDLAPTVLDLFGIPKPAWMEGKCLLGAE